MTSEERFRAAVEHRSPDRVPIDLGATGLTGMRPRCQERLLDVLGQNTRIVPTNSGVDERILDWAGTDFRSVGHIVSLPSSHTRQLGSDGSVDCWGIRRERVGGEVQITGSPLAGATREDLATYSWPEPVVEDALLDDWVAEAKRLHRETDYVLIAQHPVLGIVELGCWLCGYDDFLFRLAGDQDFVRDFFDRVLRIQLRIAEQYYAPLADYIELTTSGDDFGIQTGPFMSPAMFAELVAPHFAERIRVTKLLGRCLYWHHSCGSVAKLLPQIIDCGVDILNPVQTSAADMAPERLKDRFGERIVFWGAIDIQDFLRTATPAEVREGTADLIRVLGANGGYVTAPAHEVQDDVPAENIVAWIETAQQEGHHGAIRPG